MIRRIVYISLLIAMFNIGPLIIPVPAMPKPNIVYVQYPDRDRFRMRRNGKSQRQVYYV
jgi:hypothetical protein